MVHGVVVTIPSLLSAIVKFCHCRTINPDLAARHIGQLIHCVFNGGFQVRTSCALFFVCFHSSLRPPNTNHKTQARPMTVSQKNATVCRKTNTVFMSPPKSAPGQTCRS